MRTISMSEETWEKIKDQVEEEIRDILNEKMDDYDEAQGTGEKDKVFDTTCEEITETIYRFLKLM